MFQQKLNKFIQTLQQIKEEFPHLVHGNVAFARKMGFPEVIFPGDVRNDLYLTMISGEFTKGSKGSDKNIEVTAVVCDEKGVIMPGIITLGAGAPMVSEYKSVIYYHEDKPKWHETFKVSHCFSYMCCCTSQCVMRLFNVFQLSIHRYKYQSRISSSAIYDLHSNIAARTRPKTNQKNHSDYLMCDCCKKMAQRYSINAIN